MNKLFSRPIFAKNRLQGMNDCQDEMMIPFLCLGQQNIILILAMRAKQRNFSLKHQARSEQGELHSRFTKIQLTSSQTHLEEVDPREILCKFDDEHSRKQIPQEQDGIIGWESNGGQTFLKKAVFFNKETRKHERKPYYGKLESINRKNISKCSTNDTINYLKQMLRLLRSSRQEKTPQKEILKQRQNDNYKGGYQTNKKLVHASCGNTAKIALLRDSQINIGKQNEYTDAQIINQLKHGLLKLPSINQQKRSTINIRPRKTSKFTLDKLLA